MRDWSWYQSALVHIGRALAGVPLETGEGEVRRILREAYPFGERKYWPYKCWLRAVRDMLAARRQGLLAPVRRASPPDPRQLSLF